MVDGISFRLWDCDGKKKAADAGGKDRGDDGCSARSADKLVSRTDA